MGGEQQKRWPVWLWPNLLSLDAPVVALVWQGWLAKVEELPLFLPGQLGLFLSVWAIYLADRLLDVMSPEREGESARHAFIRRNKKLAWGILVVVVLVDARVAFQWMRMSVFLNGVLVAGLASLYLLFVHGGVIRWRGAKEIAVALLFAVGTFVAPVSNAKGWEDRWVLMAGLYFALCLANLVLIEKWEGRWALGGAWWLMGLVGGGLLSGTGAWGWSVALGALGLLVVDRSGWAVEKRRVLADVVLLAPVVWLV